MGIAAMFIVLDSAMDSTDHVVETGTAKELSYTKLDYLM